MQHQKNTHTIAGACVVCMRLFKESHSKANVQKSQTQFQQRLLKLRGMVLFNFLLDVRVQTQPASLVLEFIRRGSPARSCKFSAHFKMRKAAVLFSM